MYQEATDIRDVYLYKKFTVQVGSWYTEGGGTMFYRQIKALKKMRANVSDSFKVLMIENSSIEIGCIYFFQITINVFSSSSLQLNILGRLK